MVNVFQAVLLTEGPQMIKTPTWHVFRMYRDHHGAEALPVSVANLSMSEGQTVRLDLGGRKVESAAGTLLADEAGVAFVLPPCGVASVQLR